MSDEDFRDLIEEYDSAEGYGQKLATRKALMDAFRSARRTVSDAQAECGKSSGEAVGEITHSSFEGWYFHPYINWPEIGDGTKLYAAPQHSADIDAMRLDAERYRFLKAGAERLDYDAGWRSCWQIKSVDISAGATSLDAAIDAALQAKGVASCPSR